MRGPEYYEEGGSGVVFRDLILLALLGFAAIVILMLPHINTPGKTAQATVTSPGSMMIDIHWPEGWDSDVDLWVQAPGDVPVGYSNKGGIVFNLLRDDLGKPGDTTKLNHEVSYARGLVPGEYTANVHLYRNVEGRYPIPVTLVVSAQAEGDAAMNEIFSTTVDLHREGEEITAVRFSLNETGRLVDGSVHTLQRPLRSAGGQ